MPGSGRAVLALCAAALALITAPLPATAGRVGPDDPVFEQGLQWGLERIAAPGAWSRGAGAGTTIAVIDSGADLTHEDLRNKVVRHVSCIGAAGDPARCTGSGQDDNGHGTHVAAIAAADTGNRRGIAGVAPEADLMVVKVLANSCSQDTCSATGAADDVSAGIRWAADNGADVINLSLGGGALQGIAGCAFCEAVEHAWSRGAIPVIAAGNDSVLPEGFADEHAVIVTATTRGDALASYSNASSGLLSLARWPVAAPGGETETSTTDCATSGTPKGILSAYWMAGERDRYACLAGTSMAAPHVSGALSVLLSTGRSPDEAVERLLATAQDLGPPGRDDQFGAGLVDLGRAVGTAAGNATTSTAPPETMTPSTTSVTAGNVPSPPSSPPPVRVPEPSQAAPFVPGRPSAGVEEVPGWLIALAVGAILAAGGGTVAAAWHFAELEER